MRAIPVSRWRSMLWILPLLVPTACAHKVVSFSAEPPLVCAGERVKVEWDVEGRASLRTDRGDGDSTEMEVSSQGEQSPAVEKRTTFTIRALDANTADPPSFASKSVDVASAPIEKGVNAVCDAAARKCRGSFTIRSESQTVMVRTLSGPRMVQAGRAAPATICVSHEGIPPTCLSGDDRVAVAVPAQGPWELETDLPADYAGPPDPQLRVRLGFGCP
jgi:hypothetical protein